MVIFYSFPEQHSKVLLRFLNLELLYQRVFYMLLKFSKNCIFTVPIIDFEKTDTKLSLILLLLNKTVDTKKKTS